MQWRTRNSSGVYMKQILIWLLFATSSATLAVESDAVAKQEIDHLIRYLGSSGCQFNRNGSWFSASQAVSHLKRKYEYLVERKRVPTAEAFIEGAASESSSSGKPYLVKCSGQPEVKSAAWFGAELARFREESKNPAKHD
jgi:Family of unknown function (DUF5329)